MNYCILFLGLALHLLAAWLFIRHCRAERHRARIPVIGSSPLHTEVLHQRLCDKQPQTDWLNPHVMRAKIHAWLRRNR
jgi:hypothetical protein